ncbi:MAG: hypothetical protein HOV80_25910 [Polyangiaceae bacterium]|nr:hypothetical protein [Polyangiaceae bacterium]
MLAVSCGAAAWLVCDFQRLGVRAGDDLSRIIAIAAAFGAGALLGSILQSRSVSRSRLGTAIMLMFILPLFGAGVGAIATLSFAERWYWALMMREGSIVGALGALAALPGLALTVRAVRRADDARPGSMVHEIERRALWTLPCAAIAIGAPFALHGNPSIVRFGDYPGGVASLALGVSATLTLVVTLAQAIGGARFASSVWATASELRPRESDTLYDHASIPRIDLGVGEGELEHYRSPGVAYRSAGGVQSIVKGDPVRALAIARKAAFVTGIALTLATVATGWGLTQL